MTTRRKEPIARRTNGRVHKGLTPMMSKFAAAYAELGDATKAATKAGYSAKTAASQGARLLANKRVSGEVQRIMAAGAARAEITVERIMSELALGGFADLTDFVEWDTSGVRLKASKGLDAAKRRAVVEVSEGPAGVRIKLMGKVSSLELMGKQIGMFKHQIELPTDPANGQPLGLILVPYKAPSPTAPTAPTTAPPEPAGADDADA